MNRRVADSPKAQPWLPLVVAVPFLGIAGMLGWGYARQESGPPLTIEKPVLIVNTVIVTTTPTPVMTPTPKPTAIPTPTRGPTRTPIPPTATPTPNVGSGGYLLRDERVQPYRAPTCGPWGCR
jgi:hypothetical protein